MQQQKKKQKFKENGKNHSDQRTEIDDSKKSRSFTKFQSK